MPIMTNISLLCRSEAVLKKTNYSRGKLRAIFDDDACDYAIVNSRMTVFFIKYFQATDTLVGGNDNGYQSCRFCGSISPTIERES